VIDRLVRVGEFEFLPPFYAMCHMAHICIYGYMYTSPICHEIHAMCYAISYEMAMVDVICFMPHVTDIMEIVQAHVSSDSCNTHRIKQFNHLVKTHP
jgi:hypothetical protein